MIRGAREVLRGAGYAPYYMYRQKYQAGNNENAGWTKRGKACVYNVDVMEETADNLALGANAVSKRVFNSLGRIERFATPKDLPTYLGKVDEIIEKRRKFFQ
jgi:oxygen-independent coproporphyrinogen-3 oxidase